VHAIVLIISPHFAASKVCSDELSHAIRNNKRIIPILREDLDESTLPDAVRGRQWLFFTEKDDFEQASIWKGKPAARSGDDLSSEDDWQVFNKLKQEIRL
jgi:TIR domain